MNISEHNAPVAASYTKQRGRKREDMRRTKRKTVWAYLDGEKLCDVVQAALDNNMTVDDLKKQLIKENPGRDVTFKCQ